MNGKSYLITAARSSALAISEQLPESVASAVIELIAGTLTKKPRAVATSLRGDLEGLWSARRGTFRIIFRIDDNSREITLL